MGEAGLPWHPPEGSPLIPLPALSGHVRPGISQAEEGLTPLRVSWSFSQERAFLLRGAFLDMEVIYLAGEKIHLQRESYKENPESDGRYYSCRFVNKNELPLTGSVADSPQGTGL